MLKDFVKRFVGVPMFSTSWITMLSCEVRRQDKEERLRQELQKFQSGQNVKLDAKTRLKFYQFLKPEEVFDGPRVKDQTPSQIQEMLEVIYDRMQYF
uniref:Uncharacterized protein n=1 Tax=Magallana gigas TaxID=29159 RepID=A0A8W8IME6_MAGGI